ncbi:sugar transferase [Novosphingobium ginsenosidimutans]|nr:sugar transferase [Novosphingobium ginsenosidimutans]
MTAQSFTVPPSLERTRLRIYAIQLLLDGAMLLAGFALSTWLYLGSPTDDTVWGSAQLALPLYWTVALLNRTYSVQSLIAPEFGVQRASSALLLASLLVLLALFLARSSLNLSRFGYGLGCFAALFLMIWARYNLEPLVRSWVGARAINLLVIDDGGPPVDLTKCHRVDARALGLPPQLDDPHGLDRLAKLIGPMDRVIVTCPPERRRLWAMVLKGGHMRGEIVDTEVIDLGILGTSRSEGVGTLVVAAGPLGLRSRLLKRGFDLAITLPLLLVLAGPMLLVALAIRLEDGGPALFRQRRVGRNNRFFDIYKFRTMKVAQTDQAGARSASRDDDRVTRIGHWLRRTSIDELPQLLNVVKGEMSLVGPRPHALASQAGDKLFWEVDDRYWQRHALKPGMSGLAQVRGFRGETREESDLSQRLQADLEYQAGWTLWRDVVIILRTLQVVVHERAY